MAEFASSDPDASPLSWRGKCEGRGRGGRKGKREERGEEGGEGGEDRKGAIEKEPRSCEYR